MKPEIKKLWIAALRSGSYKQGKMVLRNNINEFCCLGVLCDIMNNRAWSEPEEGDYYKWNSFISYPTSEVREMSEMTLTFDEYSDLNDKHDKTFNEIADYIEEYE